MSRLTYYLPDHGETPKDACELKLCYEEKAKYFAENAAEYCQNYRDGWKWKWPTVFVILRDGVEAGRFNVERELVPEFIVSEIPSPAPAP